MTAAATPNTDRLQGSLQAILELLLPRVMGQLACYAQWEYRVVLVNLAGPGQPIVVACTPVDAQRCPFGPLTVPMWRGTSGLPSVPVVGSRVVVRFNDANPAKPAIVATDPAVPTVPPTGAYVPVPPPGPALPLTLAGALSTFATGLNPGNLAAQAALLVTTLTELL